MTESDSRSQPLVHRAAVVGGFTFLSRITGLIRTILIARFLGHGPVADAYQVAFLLPNLFRRLIGEGTLFSAFVPVYAQHCQTHKEQESRVFVEKFLTLWVILLLALTVLGVILVGWVIPPFFGHGSFGDPEKLALTIGVSRVGFWYLLFIGCAAVGQAVLSARGFFGTSAFAPVVANLAFIAVALCLPIGEDSSTGVPRTAAYWIMGASLVGGLCQAAFLLRPLHKLGIRFRPRSPSGHPEVRQVLRLLVPGTVGAGVHQINVLFSAAIAAGIPYNGAVTGLRYSNMVMEFVLGIFVFALNTVGLTLLSRHAGRDDLDGFCALIDRLLRLVIFITIPSTVGLFLLNEPLLALLFKGGVFNERSLSLTASAFRFHVLGILFVGVNRVLVSGFHSRRNLRTPVILAVINMALNLSLAWWLSTTTLAHGGIALATTLAAVAQTAFLGIALKREIPQLSLAPLVPTTIKTLLAASVMGVVCYGVLQVSPQDGGKLVQGARVFGVVAAGVGTFFGVAWVLRAEELRSLLGGLFSRR